MENRIIKWGIIGTGNIARAFATALKSVEKSELLAIGSRDLQKAKSFADEFGIKMFFGSYPDLLSEEEIDIVYIATPHNLHFENTMMALEKNKAVLCEKPFAVNIKEAELMINKAKEKNLFIMEALWSRFLPNILKAKEIVNSGELGKIKLLNASFCFKSPYSEDHRHFNINLCGGTILDIGIYNVFLSLLFLGKPNSINAIASLSHSGVDISSSYLFEYDHALSVMYSSFIADSPIVAEIHCEKGKILLNHRWFAPGSIKVIYHTGKEEDFHYNFPNNGYEFQAIEAVNCILDGKKESTIWTTRNTLELMELLDIIRRKCGVNYPNHDNI